MEFIFFTTPYLRRYVDAIAGKGAIYLAALILLMEKLHVFVHLF